MAEPLQSNISLANGGHSVQDHGPTFASPPIRHGGITFVVKATVHGYSHSKTSRQKTTSTPSRQHDADSPVHHELHSRHQRARTPETSKKDFFRDDHPPWFSSFLYFEISSCNPTLLNTRQFLQPSPPTQARPLSLPPLPLNTVIFPRYRSTTPPTTVGMVMWQVNDPSLVLTFRNLILD
jgi:hypothetical protein